jgi:hypothetical protein
MTDDVPASTTTSEEPVEATAAPRARGWLSLYAIAFALMMVAAAFFAAATIGTLTSLRMLRVSTLLSAIAIVVAILAVVLPRRP